MKDKIYEGECIMDYPIEKEVLGEPSLKLDGEINSSKEEKRKAWEWGIGMNQLDGEWIPSEELKELMEKEINGEITTEEIREILIKKYTVKVED
jgi:hypothetical protein